MLKSLLFITFLVFVSTLNANIITSFDSHGKKEIVLTFDACETKTPSFFDPIILGYLVEHRISATFFVSAKFAQRNSDKLREIVQKYPFLEIENHSNQHFTHMEDLNATMLEEEIISTEQSIYQIIGTRTKYFRFPAGNYDDETLKKVEEMGYKVVHWSFASGDPDKHIDSLRLVRGVLSNAKAGNILIFHINGRGYATPQALPHIVENLQKKGYTFMRLDEALANGMQQVKNLEK